MSACVAALCSLPSIESLNISGNHITDSDVTAVADAIRDGSARLTSLDLSSNQIGDQGAAALKLVLERHHSLKKLCLNRNQIGNEGAWQLFMGLLLGGSCRVFLKCNQLDEECQEEILRQESGNRFFL